MWSNSPHPALCLDSHTFDAILVLNGQLPDADFFSQNNGTPLYVADGAALALAAHGIAADVIVGDLDSLKPEHLTGAFINQANIIHTPDQDTNDFEKLARIVIADGKKRLLICGFHGGDLEHTLNNWSVLTKISAEFATVAALCVYDNGRYAIPVHASLQIALDEGETVSLIAQPSVRLTTKGLEWELTNEVLHLGIREGARNRAASPEVSITLHEGAYLLCCNARLPFAPVFNENYSLRCK